MKLPKCKNPLKMRKKVYSNVYNHIFLVNSLISSEKKKPLRELCQVLICVFRKGSDVLSNII